MTLILQSRFGNGKTFLAIWSFEFWILHKILADTISYQTLHPYTGGC